MYYFVLLLFVTRGVHVQYTVLIQAEDHQWVKSLVDLSMITYTLVDGTTYLVSHKYFPRIYILVSLFSFLCCNTQT